MRRFLGLVVVYVVVCLVAGVGIVLHGDGPHPRIAWIYPQSGDQYWPGGIVQSSFSQSMNQSRVERDLVVSPGSQGPVAWYGDTVWPST